MNEMETLYERLAILEQGGLITPHVSEQVKKIIGLVFERKERPDMEKLEMITTHIAMAIQRILNGERENPLDDAVLAGLREEAVYPDAERFAQNIYEHTDIEFPEVEKGYLVVHLCNLFS